MTKEEANKALVEHFANDFVNTSDVTVYEEVVAKAYKDYSSPKGGYQSMLDTFIALRAGMPNLHVVLEQLVAEGDFVAGRKTLKGTHTGNLFGLPPTGRQVAIHVVDLIRIEQGQFMENWAYNDANEVIAALAN